MQVEFIPNSKSYDVIANLEMPMPPRVGETINFWVRERKAWARWQVMSVGYQQMEQDRTCCATKFGMVDVVGAVCVVIEVPEED